MYRFLGKKGKKYFMYKFMKILALVLIFLGFVPSSEIAGSHGNSTFNIGGNANVLTWPNYFKAPGNV